MTRRMLVSLLALLSVFLAAAPAMAHDIIPILPPERRGGPPAIQLQSLQAEVAVSENVARITLDQVFVNRTPGPAEGTYMFPLPPGASLSSFQMFVDGQAYTAEVLKADEARAIYESIVRRNRDPALLQYVGQGLLQARVFPIPPGQERRIRVQYEQVLPKDGGLSELRIPMSREPIPEVSVAVEIRGESVGQVYSPTHSVSVSKGTDGSVSAGLEGRQLQGDFRLFFGAESDSVGVQLLTYKTSGEDGYFLLLVDPPTRAEESERVAQDVLLVLDLSGSMSGEKFEQAKGAALQILGSLGQDDRFAVVGFHSGTVTYADELRGYGEVKEAMDYVRSLQLGGATNISEAMAQAQAIAGPAGGRPQTIVLITDGQPTAGEREPSRIVEAVRAKATASQRIFTFGVGYDVNTVLLDAMAQENRGRSDYVKPGENLESAVAAFWRKVGQPVLADVTLQFSGIKAEEVYPRPLPDLYLGSQMVVLGRYRQGGDARLTLQGTVNGTARSYTFDDLSFATRDTSRDYVPRLWASRKVGYLLGEIRRNGSNQELIDEVVALSQRYGIATPYTSFFVNEPGQPMPAPGTVQPGDLSFAPAKKEAADAMARNIAAAPASGQAAVEQSQQVGAMQEAKALSDTQPDAGQVRTVGHKAFAWKNAIWVDTTYTGGDLIYLKLGSDQYLKLVAARPDLAPFLAVGTPLVLVDGDRAYGIDIPGQAETNLPKDATNLPAEPGALPEQQQTPEAQQQQSGRGTPRWPMLAGGGLALSLGVAVLIFLRRPHST